MVIVVLLPNELALALAMCIQPAQILGTLHAPLIKKYPEYFSPSEPIKSKYPKIHISTNCTKFCKALAQHSGVLSTTYSAISKRNIGFIALEVKPNMDNPN